LVNARVLFNVITTALEQENILSSDTRSKIDAGHWLKLITTLRQAYLDTPSSFRFDKVSLYKEQVNPDYEHLWFKFKEVRFGDSYWPDFQFRLSAANVKAGKFQYFPNWNFHYQKIKLCHFGNGILKSTMPWEKEWSFALR